MSKKYEFLLNGHAVKVVGHEGFWEVHFPEVRHEKLFYHVNADGEGLWMWESGNIDDDSLSIGALIDEALGKGEKNH